MNEDASISYKKADKKLNSVYKKILKEYEGDSIFVKNLKTSQRLWIQFRDAELHTRYPDYPEGDPHYGSVLPMCEAGYLESLTLERIKTLQEWLDGTEEGDVCAGSVKFKE